MTDTAEAVKAVWQSGLLPEDATNDQLEATTAKALNLAATFDQDVAGTAAAAGQMIKTGLAANADEAFDIITRGFQEGVDKRGDYLDTLNEYGIQFQKLGIDGSTATGLLSQGLRGGARDADLVADAFKEFSIRAIDGSTATADGFALAGLNAGKMSADIAAGGTRASEATAATMGAIALIEDPIARAAAATALFGTQAEDLGDAFFALDLGTAAKGIGEVEGAADQMGATLSDNAGAKIETFKRQAQQVFIDLLGNRVVPVLMAVAGWVGRNSQVLIPLGAAIGGVATAIYVINTAQKVWTASLAAFNVVAGMNPVVLITLAIIALVAIIIVAWQHSETFRDVVTAAFGVVLTVVKGVWQWVSDNWPLILAILTGPIGLAVLAITKNWDDIKGGFTAVKTWITDKWNEVVGFFSSSKDTIAGFFGDMADKITAPFKGAFKIVAQVWNATIGKISFTIPDWVKYTGIGIPFAGRSFNVPDVPIRNGPATHLHFHAPGVVVTEHAAVTWMHNALRAAARKGLIPRTALADLGR